MLAVSRERRLAALKSMRRYLSRVQVTADPDAEAASSELLAGAAAVVTRDEPAHEPFPATPVADGAPSEATAPEATPASVEQPVMAGDADRGAWLEQPGLDLVLTDAAEPAPAWLTAARPDADQVEPSEASPDVQSDADGAVDAPVATPGVTPVADSPAPGDAVPERSARSDDAGGDPPERAGWGTLFARPPGQTDR